MMTMVAVCVLAFATMTTEGAFGVDALFAAREGFAGAVRAPRSVDIGAGRFCGSRRDGEQHAATPAAVDKRIRFTLSGATIAETHLFGEADCSIEIVLLGTDDPVRKITYRNQAMYLALLQDRHVPMLSIRHQS